MAVNPRPEGYTSVTPYLIVNGAAKALDYYSKAFGAEELMRFPGPEGKIMHAEIRIGDAQLMLADEFPQMNAVGPSTLGGTSVGFMIYVNDVDTAFAKAIAAGGKEVMPVKNQFYGDRSGTLLDPFGHKWTLATHVEDVSMEEMQNRMKAMGPECSGG